MMMDNMLAHDPLLRTLGYVADENDVLLYVVGGYVRDRLLGKKVKDIDFVVLGDGPAFAQRVAKCLHTTNFTVYRAFGTAMVHWEDYILEFVGARSESYRGNSRKPQVQSADLMSDLSRRDFTINAIAVSLNNASYGQVIDPFHGVEDLGQKRIKTPLDPEKTFFDDPLRIMRAIRFATQLHFDIDASVKAGLTAVKDRLQIISQERITDEFFKILGSPKPSIGFHLMNETGVLDIILPEIVALKGVDQIAHFRHKDVFHHTIRVIDNVAKASHKLELRLVALFHDVAKPLTKEFKSGQGWTFHGHDEQGARMMEEIGRRMKFSTEMIRYAQKLIRLHLRPINLAEEEVTDSAIRRLLVDAGEEIDDLILFCKADITSKNPRRVAQHLTNFDTVVRRIAEVEEKDRLRHFQPPIRGDEIMRVCGIPPGPLVGRIKSSIEEAILNGEIPNEYEAAYQYLLQIKARFCQRQNDRLLDQT